MITFPRNWAGQRLLQPMLHTRGRGRPNRLLPHEATDQAAILNARMLRNYFGEKQGGTTTQWTEMLFVNGADYSAFNTSASEGSILGGPAQQPSFPAFYFDGQKGVRRSVWIQAQGILGTTSTPTITFQARLGTAAGSSSLTGASVGVTAAITTQGGVSNQYFYLSLILTNYTPGLGSGADTISGAGYVMSPGGFASPFIYALMPTTPPTATWTQTFDASVTTYVNLSVTWSANSASNTITCKNLWCLGMN